MATYEEKKKEFLKLFANDPDIKIVPLPDSVRDKLGIYQDISFMKVNEAVNKCLFSGNRYESMEEIKQEPIDFPDLTKFKKIIEDEEEKKED